MKFIYTLLYYIYIFFPFQLIINKNQYYYDFTIYYLPLTVFKLIHFPQIDLTQAFTSAGPEAKLGSITKNYQSGMVQSWNKFCFTGGIIEVNIYIYIFIYIYFI
jgi:hypothetical protein